MPRIYIDTVPTNVKFTVPQVTKKDCGGPMIDVSLNGNADHVTISPNSRDWSLPVHKDQINDLRQALKDCLEIIEKRDNEKEGQADVDKE